MKKVTPPLQPCECRYARSVYGWLPRVRLPRAMHVAECADQSRAARNKNDWTAQWSLSELIETLVSSRCCVLYSFASTSLFFPWPNSPIVLVSTVFIADGAIIIIPIVFRFDGPMCRPLSSVMWAHDACFVVRSQNHYISFRPPRFAVSTARPLSFAFSADHIQCAAWLRFSSHCRFIPFLAERCVCVCSFGCCGAVK